MEIAKNGIASGSIRDLPPSKRFKFVNSDLGSTPCLQLPATELVFPPPPGSAAAGAAPLCLPAKKRAILAAPSQDAAPVCLPAKKRAYAPLVDAVTPPACLPAKKRPYAPPPAADSVAWPCVPTKKRVHAPPPREIYARFVPVCPAGKSRVDGRPTRKDAAGPVPVCQPAKKRIHELQPRKDAPGSVPVPACTLAKNRVHGPPPRKDAAGPAPAPAPMRPPAKKHAHPPSPRKNAAGLVAVCLPTNKRVMPPLPPPLESNGARLGAVKDMKPQGSSKHGASVVNPRLGNGAEGNTRGEEIKKSEKSINPKEIKEFVPLEPSKPRSPKKAKDLGKEACSHVPDVKPSKVELSKKAVEATDTKQAERNEESRKAADEAAREQEPEAAEDDDGVLCAVCASTDGDPSDPIVFCDGCDLMVHASCYGNPLAQAIPDGDWFCSLCSANKSKVAEARPRCCLCPAKGGAMKRTMEGQWAHIACALLVPEVFFRDPDGRDGVDCSRVPAHRFTKECYICESSNGCALECSQHKCGRGFHVSCGIDGGLCIEYQEGKGGAIVAGFCREHTELWEKQQLTGKYKIVARGQ